MSFQECSTVFLLFIILLRVLKKFMSLHHFSICLPLCSLQLCICVFVSVNNFVCWQISNVTCISVLKEGMGKGFGDEEGD